MLEVNFFGTIRSFLVTITVSSSEGPYDKKYVPGSIKKSIERIREVKDFSNGCQEKFGAYLTRNDLYWLLIYSNLIAIIAKSLQLANFYKYIYVKKAMKKISVLLFLHYKCKTVYYWSACGSLA
jgi:hypothetical protein